MQTNDALALADYRRHVAEIYAKVRSGQPTEATWRSWVAARDRLFRSHPQSAIAEENRPKFVGLPYFAHDPDLRFQAVLEAADATSILIPHSSAGTTRFVAIGTVSLAALGSEGTITVYWLDAYGGGLFLPFRDGTAGSTTYGGGRYLLDGVKGADLGSSGDTLTIDFNYAYHPSCVHNDQWSCPLAPPSNRIDLAIEAGERLATA